MSEEIVEVNAVNWEEAILESEKLVLVEFWHQECPHCKVFEPVYKELSKEYRGKLEFAKINVLESQENQEIAAKYGIMGTPTLKFFCQGRPVQDIVGVLPKDYLQQAIEFAISKHQECAEKSSPLNLTYIS